MSRLHYLGVIFAVTLASYLIAVLFGFALGRRGTLSLSRFVNLRERVTDPLTRWIHSWMRPRKLRSISQRKWSLLFLLIFLNNLLLVAFIGRTVYGVIFLVPYVLIILQGLAEGVAHAQFGKGPNLMTISEFGGYLFASVAGINLGLSLLSSLIKSSVIPILAALEEMAYIYVIVGVFLCVGALLETSFLKTADLPDVSQADLDKLTMAAMKMHEDRAQRGSGATLEDDT